MKKLFLALFLISSSNIAHSGQVMFLESTSVVTDKQCLLMLNEGNVLSSEKTEYGTKLNIVYDNYFHFVTIDFFGGGKGQFTCRTRHPLTVRE